MNDPDFRVEFASWTEHLPELRAVREPVFLVEQAVTPELEWDELDATSTHVLARDRDDQPIGTARTGQGALAYIEAHEQQLEDISELVGGNRANVVEKLRQVFERQKKLEKELESLKARAAAGAASDLAASARVIGDTDTRLVAARLDGLDVKGLRESVDQLKQKLPDAVIVLASGQNGKANLVAGVQGKALGAIRAGEVVAFVADRIDGKGGGRADMAQGGGQDDARLPAALSAVAEFVASKLGV